METFVVPANARDPSPLALSWKTLLDGFRALTKACGYGSARLRRDDGVVLLR